MPPSFFYPFFMNQQKIFRSRNINNVSSDRPEEWTVPAGEPKYFTNERYVFEHPNPLDSLNPEWAEYLRRQQINREKPQTANTHKWETPEDLGLSPVNNWYCAVFNGDKREIQVESNILQQFKRERITGNCIESEMTPEDYGNATIRIIKDNVQSGLRVVLWTTTDDEVPFTTAVMDTKI